MEGSKERRRIGIINKFTTLEEKGHSLSSLPFSRVFAPNLHPFNNYSLSTCYPLNTVDPRDVSEQAGILAAKQLTYSAGKRKQTNKKISKF